MLKTTMPDAERAVRDARAASNVAMAARDLEGIASFWAHNVLVQGSAGGQLAGIEANRFALGRHFERRPDTLYVRTPMLVEIFAPWSVASEQGTWVGRWTEPDGAIEIGGRYQARWHCTAERWLIQGELFVPTYCHGGAYCRISP